MNSVEMPTSGDLFEGRYKIGEMIGKGGFSHVYRAKDSQGRDIALKILKPAEQVKKKDYARQMVDRFLREAHLLEQLKDPHCITMYSHGETSDGLLYMAFEYVEGRSLFKIIKHGGALPPPRAANILGQTLMGLRAAHGVGILHRDIKPPNIMVFRDGSNADRVKLLDFGVAKGFGPGGPGSDLTATGTVVGTPRYMSPEQLRCQTLGPPSDIYSLGIVGFEMLTGRKMILERDRTKIIQRQIDPSPFRLPSDLDVPDRFRNIIHRMLEKSTHARYRSAAEVLRDLEHWDEAIDEGKTVQQSVRVSEISGPQESAGRDDRTIVQTVSTAELEAAAGGQSLKRAVEDDLDETIAHDSIETTERAPPEALRRQNGSGQQRSGQQRSGQQGSGQQGNGQQGNGQQGNGQQGSGVHRSGSGVQSGVQQVRGRAGSHSGVQQQPRGRSGSHSGVQQQKGNPFEASTEPEIPSQRDQRQQRTALDRRNTQMPSDLAPPPDDQGQMTEPQPSPGGEQQLTKTPSPELSTKEIAALILSFFLPGTGHMLVGKPIRGLAILAGLILTLGLGYFVALAVVFDVYLVIRAERTREVGRWEFFPGFNEILG